MNNLNRSLIDQKITETGLEIFAKMEKSNQSLFNKDWWYGRIMEWSMKNDHFKTQMFRFVDVLPYLKSSGEVARHLKEYFAESDGDLPSVFNFGVGVGSLAPGLMAGTIKKNVSQMAKMFITGETPQQALVELRKARQRKLCFTVDLLGEATLSEKEALEYQQRYIELINDLSADAQNWENIPQVDESEEGFLPKVNISVKITSLYSQIKDTAWEQTCVKIKERLRPIFSLAKERHVFINVDMEQYAHKDLTLDIFRSLISEEEFRNYPHFGIVIQAYLRDSLEDVKILAEFAKQRGTPFTIRLVKGAYWDFETIHADQYNWPIPVYTNKKESDANYEDCCHVLLSNYPHIRLAVGSHNVRSIAAALVMARELGLKQQAIEVQMLYGMAEPIKNALVKMGYRVREYATVGELIPGMAYLVRRLLENTSNESFLRSKFADNTDSTQLLSNPKDHLLASTAMPPKNPELFYNEALCDFAIKYNREQMQSALNATNKKLGQRIGPIINHKELKTDQIFTRNNPSHSNQVVGEISMASVEQAELAVKVAKEAFTSWKNKSANERISLIEKLAELIARDRFELAALEVYEVGKTWKEADGDICEAIDFCRYYARDMRKLAQPQRVGHAKGETSFYVYQPRGVATVIAPWNFPLAILTGMVSGALVTGNTVIMKPAEQSSLIAYQLMKLAIEAGIPKGVLNFVPGYGENVGEYLVNHKDVNLIAFTGSKEVGLSIVNKSAHVHPGQTHVKHCIIEMGGKNAIIVDSDADYDEAVAGVLYSAFGFQGQKCSACSRLIVLEENYDRFMERFLEAVKSIDVLPTENPQAYMGPVVDKEAYNKIVGMIERAKSYATLSLQKDVPKDGFYIPPTVFENVPTNSELAQNEVFGPVLAVMKAKNFDEAIKIANDTAFALTGGLYSRSPANIERAKQEINVGNFYINRSITGALVERHPFGGFKMSGLGSKTGGPDYLKQFLEPRVITENTMRRGFAPD